MTRDDWPRGIVELIKKYRKRSGLSQSKLAKLIEINYRHYQEIESGRVQFKVDTLLKIATGLGIKIGDLLPPDHSRSESGGEYRHLLECSSDFVFKSRIDNFQFVMVNKRACDFYGYTQEEFLKMNIFDIEVDAPLENEVRRLYDQTEIGVVVEVFGHNRKKDGSVFPVHVRFSKVDDVFALANVRDITEIEAKFYGKKN